MRDRFKRACVAATILGVLAVPAVGSQAADDADLDELAERLEDLKDNIDSLESQADGKKERVQLVSEGIADLEIAINELEAEIDKVEAKAAVAESRIKDTERDIAKVEGRALEQAVALYKGGGLQNLDALLSSTTLGELNDRVQMLGIAAEENTGELIRYGRLKVTLEDQFDELFLIQEDLNAKLASKEDYEAELETRKEALLADIEDLNGEIDEEQEKVDKTQERYDDISAEIAAAASPSSTFTPPATAPDTGSPSASGFIWPVNGAVTSPYGYRWGRMHEGIDIDGYTGQPIVASKSGRVISAGDSGDGYGTKVVLDHGGGYSTLYAHMSSMATSSGATVSQGSVIGYVGCTGSCTGDHLHFEVRVNGGAQDPLGYLP